MKIPDRKCIPLGFVRRGLHLPFFVIIIFVNIQSKSKSIVNFDNSNVLGCHFNIKTGKVWFESLSGCGLCKKVQ